MPEVPQRVTSQAVSAQTEAVGANGNEQRGPAEDGWHREKSRSHQQQSPLQRFVRRNWMELVALLVVALGAFLVFERLNIRETLTGWLRSAARGLIGWSSHLGSALSSFLADLSLSDRVGIVLVLAALVAGAFRLRYRLMHAANLTTIACPACGGSLRRTHRTLLDRWLSNFVPVLRYQCTNSACRWRGLRVSTSHRQHSRNRA